MIYRRANPLLGPLKGVDPGNLDFFWVQMAFAALVVVSGPKKVSVYRVSFNGPSNGYTRLKIKYNQKDQVH
jgi:hypothetical protein